MRNGDAGAKGNNIDLNARNIEAGIGYFLCIYIYIHIYLHLGVLGDKFGE